MNVDKPQTKKLDKNERGWQILGYDTWMIGFPEHLPSDFSSQGIWEKVILSNFGSRFST